ncbi:MAG TPA: methyltransferase [Mucilaginibacter sp.]|jgi:SAM-dependent methyltransferase
MSGNFWINNAEDFLYFEHPSERDVLHPMIIERVNKLSPKTYLDFGAGDGRMTAKIEEHIPIDIYDISSQMINSARKVLGGRLKNVYTDTVNIPTEHYEVIVCSMVLICINNEHDFIKVLNNIYDSLQSGGTAIFSVTHPCFRQAWFSDFYTVYTDGKQFDYFEEGKPFDVTIHDPEKINHVTFEDYHWSLSFSINSLIKCGFRIAELVETKDDNKVEKHNQFIPPFLIIIAEKK